MDIIKKPNISAGTWEIPEDLRLQLLALLSTDPTHPAIMTYEEFLDWADEDTLAEWVEGRVVMASPASKKHQDLVRFLSDVLAAYAETHELGSILIAPFQMRLATSGREPDVIFVASDHRDRVLATRISGAADLVVEIVSPESRSRDRGEKFYEYQAGGVPEYWIIDPDEHRAEFYQLDENGLYQIMLPDADSIYRSRVMDGLWIRTLWLWQDQLPRINQVMLTIDPAAYSARLIADLTENGLLP